MLAFLILLIFGALAIFLLDIHCIFKSIFGIPCPGCGLTRAFRAIFHGNFLEAEKYNILSIPILIFYLFFFILIILDCIKKTNKTETLLKKISNHYILIIIILIINWVINIIRGI